MIRIALSNLRSASGRLVAAGIAVAVSVAFMVAALLFAQGFGDTLANQVRSSWAGADVAVLVDDPEDPADAAEPAEVLTDDLLDDVAAVDGVETAHLEETGFLMASAGASSVSASVTGLPTNNDDPVAGALPEAADELSLTEADAEALGVAVGDTVTLDGHAAAAGTEGPEYTVSGLLPGSASLQLTLHLTDNGLEAAPTEAVPTAIRVSAADGADPAALSTTIHDATGAAPVAVSTVEEVVEQQIQDLSGSTNMLATIGIAFGLLSVGVASLVISNTFQVLVASRSRVLALYRAVGATARQLRGATLLEGLVLGVVGAAAGVVLGLLIGWGLSGLVRAMWMPDFAQIAPTPAALLVGPLVGITVTVLAGMVPAFKAGGVSPIEALRPADVSPAQARFPWVRMLVGGLLGAGGLALCLLAVSIQSVVVGIAGCFTLFIAVLVAARVFVPPLIGVMGRALSAVTGRSPSILLAGRSASSAPGRTSSTTAALLIGITLVSAVLVGAASLQRTIELSTAEDTPVDLVVDGSGDEVAAVLDESTVVDERSVIPAAHAEATITGAPAGSSGADSDAEGTGAWTGDLTGDLTVASAQAADDPVLRSDGFDIGPGTIRLAPGELGAEGATADYEGLETTVAVGGETFTFTVDPSRNVPAGTALVSGEDAARIADAAGGDAAEQTWVRLADDATITQIESLTSQLSALDVTADANPSLMRAQYADIFQVAITIVLGLLAAAVVIAVIGVSNTLTLSVIDRRREGALLRALGFSRGALGRMITVESLLMTVIALVVGVGLGTFFGWVGTASLTGESIEPTLSVPPLPLALIGIAAVAAAVLASALPARTMSRVAPAEGMSEE
ncbi:FtsX-like permease family protein [Brevibacterium jeotgali]|uniref:Putative ABC transport system permease protein n=1 Tax=Brevibacterium jeotgali TaxID=1262550 RepID=A0A2H1L2T2_9MICO|nr:FtsX family ABC transporter permease [Brevibacterium jeotgali]TWC02416.1 putative ABC transport system permease protein [Brevibacterium jeotgali]SMY11208.1 putative ABC transport system permease protein [Brevibacterium jeotgali]